MPVSLAGIFRALKLLALVVVVVATAWGGHFLYIKYDVPIAVIGVDGELNQVNTADVEQTVAANLGGGFLSLDLAGICRALEQHPWIASASARRKWPNEVVIAVEEETAIARWGNDSFLSNRGEVLQVADVQLSESLPLLKGPDGMERRVMQQYRNFSQILRPLDFRVDVFELAPRGNWILTLDNGMRLTVGKEPVADKFNRFLRVWDEQLRQRAEEVASVDIRYANGIAVRWKEGAHGASVKQGTMNGKS